VHWHLLAIVASLSLGLIPMPVELQKQGFDLLFGFIIIFRLKDFQSLSPYSGRCPNMGIEISQRFVPHEMKSY
jgi:hypothetical protein